MIRHVRLRYAAHRRLARTLLAAALVALLLPWQGRGLPARAGTSDLLATIPAYDAHALNNAASGVAAAAMVLQYYRAQTHPAAPPLSLAAVSRYVKEWSWAPGHLAGATAAQLALGLAAASQAPALGVGLPLLPTWHHTDALGWRARLRTEIGRGHPLIVYLPDGGRFWHNDWHYGHYLVVSGIGLDGGVIYHDPWSGQALSVSAAAFGAAWGTPFGFNQGWWYLTAAPTPVAVAQATTVARATAVARLQATVAARATAVARAQATAGARETAAAHLAQATIVARETAVAHLAQATAVARATLVAEATAGHAPGPVGGGGGPTLWVTIAPPEFKGSGLNLRAAPSLSAPVRTLILDREPVTLLGQPVRAAGAAWDRVLYHGLTGYVDAEYLSAGRPAPGPVVAEFPLPTADAQPLRMLLGPEGNLWFVEYNGSQIGRFSLDAGGTPSPAPIAEYTLPSGNDPASLTVGPDGNIWFTDPTGNRVGWVTMGGQVQECPASPGSDPLSITTAGGYLWFTGPKHNLIGRVGTDCSYAFAALPPGSDPEHITAGPDGNLWFTEGKGDAIGAITPTGQVSQYPLSLPSADPWDITGGPDGNLWFTADTGNVIGRITPSGAISLFPIPTASSNLNYITSGPDGNLWFTEGDGNNIDSISPSSGQITEYPVPTSGSDPAGIISGPDGTIWFTERNGNAIGQLWFWSGPQAWQGPGGA